MLKSSVNFGLFYNIRISVQCLYVILIFFCEVYFVLVLLQNRKLRLPQYLKQSK